MQGKVLVLVVSALFVFQLAAHAEDGDAILGTWVTEGGKSRVEITKSDGKYYGKIIWLKEPNYPEGDKEAGKPKHDRDNPKEDKRDRPVMDMIILDGFKYAGDDTWTKGTVYDPENGKTYKCKITRTESNTLNVRGYIGISLVGRTTVWTRYEGSEKGAEEEAGAGAEE